MICPRCNSPNFHRVATRYNYFECGNCGYAEENGRPVKEVLYNYKRCPRCEDMNIGPAYRHQGYYQCGNCGYEWKQKPRGA
jgi:ribosomal protein S27AE